MKTPDITNVVAEISCSGKKKNKKRESQLINGPGSAGITQHSMPSPLIIMTAIKMELSSIAYAFGISKASMR